MLVRDWSQPDFRDHLLQAGGVATGSSPDELAAFIATERTKWTKIIVDAKITAE